MLKWLFTVVCVLAAAGCNPSSLSPERFTQRYAAEMRKAAPQLTITISAPLELKVKEQDGYEVTSFLDNAYNHYRRAPEQRDAVIAKYITSFLEGRAARGKPIDKARIVPVIKDKNYLAEIQKSLAERGQKAPEFMDLHEEYNSELWIFFAEDTPANMRFLSRKDLVALDLDTNSVRAVAVKNLPALIPRPQLTESNGFYRLQAGGDYDASLLLLDKIWSTGQIQVDGEIVVAVPARDMLLITGSSNSVAVAKVRELAKNMAADAPYRLTPELFVYSAGKFEVFRN
jgi:uncharacterized protein YtpQ (UPF0354 family)